MADTSLKGKSPAVPSARVSHGAGAGLRYFARLDDEYAARSRVDGPKEWSLSGFPTALDQETKVDTPAASGAILQWVRDHKIWVGPVVFLLSFLESFAFVSLIVPATFILL